MHVDRKFFGTDVSITTGGETIIGRLLSATQSTCWIVTGEGDDRFVERAAISSIGALAPNAAA